MWFVHVIIIQILFWEHKHGIWKTLRNTLPNNVQADIKDAGSVNCRWRLWEIDSCSGFANHVYDDPEIESV